MRSKGVGEGKLARTLWYLTYPSASQSGPFLSRFTGEDIHQSPQRSDGVWTGASQPFVIWSSSIVTVIEQPAMSSEVT